MPIYIVFFSVDAMPGIPWFNLKIIYYVIPTTVDKIQEVLDSHRDLLNRSDKPFVQVEFVQRSDTTFLDGIAKDKDE